MRVLISRQLRHLRSTCKSTRPTVSSETKAKCLPLPIRPSCQRGRFLIIELNTPWHRACMSCRSRPRYSMALALLLLHLSRDAMISVQSDYGSAVLQVPLQSTTQNTQSPLEPELSAEFAPRAPQNKFMKRVRQQFK